MTCITIPNGILCMAKIDFNCPHCQKLYSDSDEKYLNRVNANKSGYTKIKCECGNTFGMTYDIKGDAVGFKLKETMRKILKAVDLINHKIVLDGCMVTQSGFIVDLMNPDPKTIIINDIAQGLANNCRWNGHTQEFWSVAQHCCIMFDMAPDELKLTHLFHDCEEAYWGDMIKPLKNIIEGKCPEILQQMRDLRAVICDKFSIPYPGEETKKNDFNCLIWEFENIVKTNSVVAWTPKRAKKEWLKRYYNTISKRKDNK